MGRLYLSPAEWMGKACALHHGVGGGQWLLPHWEPPITVPLGCGGGVVQGAVDLLAGGRRVWHGGEELLSLGSGGLGVVDGGGGIGAADGGGGDALIGNTIGVSQALFLVSTGGGSS